MHTTGTTSKTANPYYLGAPGDKAFKALTDAIQNAVTNAITTSKGLLFTVSTDGLFDSYLGTFSNLAERQFHNCNCCHSFVKHFGGLVTISEHGNVRSAVWNESLLKTNIPPQYYRLVTELRQRVEAKSVNGQHLWKDLTWGTPEAGGFGHFHVNVNSGACDPHVTEHQAMAERLEDRKHLGAAFSDMKLEYIRKGVAMLQAGALQRSEALLPMGLFLQEVGETIKNTKGELRNRLLWHAVGRAGKGWCTPRSSAFGALVFDIIAGRSTQDIVRSHNERVAPDKYQRPQAAPSEGNIKQAEKLFMQLDLAAALRRRPMAIEEAFLFWRPQTGPKAPSGNGVFGHLQPKNGSPPAATTMLNDKRQRMTFAKFQRDVLPRALKMQAMPPVHGSYCAFTIAADPGAKPILKWDRPVLRNTGAWYLYTRGSYAVRWGLNPSQFTTVLGLSRLPPDWNGTNDHHYRTMGRVLFILEGARDGIGGSLGLFPACLINELHSVRATIEAHARSSSLEDEPRPHASGWLLSDNAGIQVAVTTHEGVAMYELDRLE